MIYFKVFLDYQMSLYKGWYVIATAFFIKTTYLAKCCKKTTYFTILICLTAAAINLPQL